MTEEAEAKPDPFDDNPAVEEKPVIKIIEPEDSAEDEEEDEEEGDSAGGIHMKRESHAPQVDVNQLSKQPDFAVVCSFFNKFGSMIGIKPLSFTKLESLLTSFEADGHVNKELMNIHLMLMRRIRMLSVRAENWENYLKKFLAINESTDEQLLQVERYGYVNLPVSSKIQILKALCDAQFDYNPKMKENMTATCKANNLRLIPLGMDKNGLIYWYQQDCEYNIRIYTEEPDDLSGVTWTLVVRTPEELDTLITKLKEADLGYKKKETDGKEKTKEPLNADPEAQMLMSTKRGTFVDLYLDEAAIKRMREFLIKQKEEKRTKKEGRKEVEEKEKEEEEVEEEEVQEEDLDRRLMPRRSAASRAVTNIRKIATPSSKRASRKKKTDDADGEDDEKDSEEKDSEEKKDGSEGSASDGDEEDEDEMDFTDEESEEDDDDEFKPKEKSKKKRRKRGPRKKKPAVEEEEEEDSDEEEVQKERKVATGDSACGQCKKSGDWDVLLLCDVCDDAWHTYCLKPMLWFVPDGDWFCPKCVHGMLIEKMEEVAKVLDDNLKKKATEDKKKKAAADRLRREMEYIGVSLNNIIPTTFKETAIPSSSSSSDEDTTQRKSKRKAVKKIAPRSRFQLEVMKTIAEGRSRRRTQRVDYNFKDYDEAIQDACDELGEERPPSRHGEVVRPSGGAGRGKDMANIIEADNERRPSVDENGDPIERRTGKPAKLAKQRKKLNDLDADENDDSDSEEYQANESEVEAADEEEAQSGSEYVPSEEERRRSRRSGGGRRIGFDGPTQSDEDFVVSDSDGSFGYRSGKGSRKPKEKTKKKKKARWASDDETSEDEAEDDDDYYSDDSREARKKKAKKAGKTTPKRRWTAREESEEDDDEGEEELVEESDDDAPRTQSGRPMRKAVAAVPKTALSDDEDEEEEDDDPSKKKDQRPVGALDRVQKKGSDSEGEFKPDEDEEDEDEEDEDEDEEEVQKGKKRKISDSEDDSDDEEVNDSKRLAPRPPKIAKTSPPKKAPIAAPEVVKVIETPKETKPLIKPMETEAKPIVKANGASKEPESRQITVNVKQEPCTSDMSSPRGNLNEMKPLMILSSPHGPPSKPTPPLPHQMGPPSGMYPQSRPSPHGGYPPHPYYQGGPPPMMQQHPGMPPGYAGMPPNAYPNPYGGPPNSGWQGGPYGPPPPGHMPNPYGPIPVHNPYGGQGPPPTSSANNYNDLQSL